MITFSIMILKMYKTSQTLYFTTRFKYHFCTIINLINDKIIIKDNSLWSSI